MKLNNFLASLPGYWCFFEALDLCLLRSKKPVWFGLYSSPKAFAIIVLLIVGVCFIWFVSPVISEKFYQILYKSRLKNLSPLIIFIFLAIFLRITLLNTPCSVGEDMTNQMLSCKQWINGESISPNVLSSPNRDDLSVNKTGWQIRPPGGALIPLPGLLVGFSLGSSIHFTLFGLLIAGGIGWLKLASTLSLPKTSMQLLALILALGTSLGSLSLLSASVITSATFPWLLLWSFSVSEQWHLAKQKFKIHLHSILFFLAIGSHAFVKLSSLLTVSGVALIPFLIYVTKSRKIGCLILVRAVVGLILFFLPYYLSSELNLYLTGISSDELYSQQDYNLQHALWGKYFSESTQGAMLATSLIASPGYASPVQELAHNFRNLLLQFENYSNTLHSYGINPRILGCCILSIPFTLVLFTGLRKINASLIKRDKILFLTLFILPFLGFAIVSHHHGFNYLIFHAYTKEFAVIFIIFSLSYKVHSKRMQKDKFIGSILTIFFIALPTITYSKSYCSLLLDSANNSYSSTFELQQGFGPSKFSESHQIIASDSNSSLDICLFLCAGNSADHSLRTPMRSLSMHFAKENLVNSPCFSSSIPLNVYCLIDPLIQKKSSYIESIMKKFPLSSSHTQLDSLTWKIELSNQ